MTTRVHNGYILRKNGTTAEQANGRHGYPKKVETRAWTRLSDGNGDTPLVVVNEHWLERDQIILRN